MRIAIFSDVHGNLNALQAVLNERVDDIYFLGDLCTLGSNPIEVAELQLNSILKSIMPKSNTDNVVSDLPLKAWLLGQYSI